MKVQVNGKYNYDSDRLQLKKGDKVKLPTPPWLIDRQGSYWVGEVTKINIIDNEHDLVHVISKWS